MSKTQLYLIGALIPVATGAFASAHLNYHPAIQLTLGLIGMGIAVVLVGTAVRTLLGRD